MKRVTMLRRFLYFGLGMVFMVQVQSFFEDSLGQEAYMKYVESHWIDLPAWLWLIPMAVAVIVLVAMRDE